IVDREARPNARFDLPPEQVREIARACLQYVGDWDQFLGQIGLPRSPWMFSKMGRWKMPVQIRVIEVGPGINNYEEQRRLRDCRRASAFSKAMISAWLLDTSAATVWTNGPPGQRWFAFLSTYQRLLRKARVAVHAIEARPLAEAAVASSDPA